MAIGLERIDALIDAVEKHLSMDDLMRTLAGIRDIDRWFTFPKFAESARFTAAELRAAGCETEVVEFPADGRTAFADFVMPLAWDAGEATLEIIEPSTERAVLARRSDEPNTTVMWCGPTPPGGATGGVVLWDELPVNERDGADLRGRFVYTRRKPHEVKAAAARRGALGVVSSYSFDRERPEFRDCVCWANAWSDSAGAWAMTAADARLPGFCISPAKGDQLEHLAKWHPGLRLRASADTRLYEGTLPLVSGLLKGRGDAEVVLIGHQFEVGAVDNASGCAAIVEAARCIARMRDAGDLPPLRRSARFITCAEMYTSIPFAVERPDAVRLMVAGLDLDMICPYRGFDSPMDFYESPDANAYFGDDLLELIIRRVWKRHGSPWRWERKRTELSDNCWCDPYVGVPMSWLSWHGREFWHSSGDTVDRVVPEAVRDVAVASIVWLAWMLTADEADGGWLAGVESARARERLAAAQDERRDYVLECETRRIRSLSRLRESAEVEDTAAALAADHEPPEEYAEDTDDEAAQLVPVRRRMAPLTFGRVPEAERKFPPPLWNPKLNSALYWADGERSVREIEWRVTLEHGSPPGVNLLDWFRFLAEHGYVDLKT